MRAGVADIEFTASKQKYKIAKIEKNNTLLFAFGQKGPLVLTIVSFKPQKSVQGQLLRYRKPWSSGLLISELKKGYLK